MIQLQGQYCYARLKHYISTNFWDQLVFFRPIAEKSYCTGDRLVVKPYFGFLMFSYIPPTSPRKTWIPEFSENFWKFSVNFNANWNGYMISRTKRSHQKLSTIWARGVLGKQKIFFEFSMNSSGSTRGVKSVKTAQLWDQKPVQKWTENTFFINRT